MAVTTKSMLSGPHGGLYIKLAIPEESIDLSLSLHNFTYLPYINSAALKLLRYVVFLDSKWIQQLPLDKYSCAEIREASEKNKPESCSLESHNLLWVK